MLYMRIGKVHLQPFLLSLGSHRALSSLAGEWCLSKNSCRSLSFATADVGLPKTLFVMPAGAYKIAFNKCPIAFIRTCRHIASTRRFHMLAGFCAPNQI